MVGLCLIVVVCYEFCLCCLLLPWLWVDCLRFVCVVVWVFVGYFGCVWWLLRRGV